MLAELELAERAQQLGGCADDLGADPVAGEERYAGGGGQGRT
jgi:hypothetical protein